jgi:uncharacterized protein (TIGR00369 family)
MPPRHAAAPEDLTPPAAMAAMGGLAFLEGMIRGDHPGPAIAGLLGFTLIAAAPGTATFRGTPTFAVTNPMGGVHGGWYGAILDSALGCAVMAGLEAGRLYTTLEYKVNLVRAIPLGTEVEAVARCVHMGRSTAVAEAEMRGVADGRLYATGNTTCLIMGR